MFAFTSKDDSKKSFCFSFVIFLRKKMLLDVVATLLCTIIFGIYRLHTSRCLLRNNQILGAKLRPLLLQQKS